MTGSSDGSICHRSEKSQQKVACQIKKLSHLLSVRSNREAGIKLLNARIIYNGNGVTQYCSTTC